ncbi:hypothetical protein WOLCODRAFT_166358 [Wolfiporia cocos MD-104 SS10]|uniref:Uncharacterized protein n=1 Tax=Wolfiporia cocos (strain MD-104) TaxID=742152 RepID=A0A2H3JFX6_WOLCO|nr:hypothetical protein WOLCODRAFT_166358 [Wolfiporia cocos MD-104 SS10]
MRPARPGARRPCATMRTCRCGAPPYASLVHHARQPQRAHHDDARDVVCPLQFEAQMGGCRVGPLCCACCTRRVWQRRGSVNEASVSFRHSAQGAPDVAHPVTGVERARDCDCGTPWLPRVLDRRRERASATEAARTVVAVECARDDDGGTSPPSRVLVRRSTRRQDTVLSAPVSSRIPSQRDVPGGVRTVTVATEAARSAIEVECARNVRLGRPSPTRASVRVSESVRKDTHLSRRPVRLVIPTIARISALAAGVHRVKRGDCFADARVN